MIRIASDTADTEIILGYLRTKPTVGQTYTLGYCTLFLRGIVGR
jgi:hypothetical protein